MSGKGKIARRKQVIKSMIQTEFDIGYFVKVLKQMMYADSLWTKEDIFGKAWLQGITLNKI